MEFKTVIESRESVRKYSNQKPNEEQVKYILEAGRMAPTAFNKQPQRIYILKSEEISYDDAPQEFLDGLTFLIMTDPVKLPKSQVILDRKTIETHLLSDQTDPFNREPLTKEMLIPCPLLKAKIEEYMKKKKEEKVKELNENKKAK